MNQELILFKVNLQIHYCNDFGIVYMVIKIKKVIAK
jgi:hypothetical protein